VPLNGLSGSFNEIMIQALTGDNMGTVYFDDIVLVSPAPTSTSGVPTTSGSTTGPIGSNSFRDNLYLHSFRCRCYCDCKSQPKQKIHQSRNLWSEPRIERNDCSVSYILFCSVVNSQ